MHDIKAIRDDKAAFVAGLKRRPAYAQSAETVADNLLAQDKALRELLTDLQTKQARRNEASKAIGKAKAQKNEDEAQKLLAEVAGLKDDIQAGEARERELSAALRDALAGLPNLPEADVPDGADEADNVPVDARVFGTRPTMNVAKEHFDLGEALGLMDFERAAKVSGSRFVYLKGQMARLERALGNFMIDVHTRDYGYTEMAPPLLVRDDAAFGTGQLPKFSDDLFSTGRLITEEELNFEAAQVIYEKYKIKGGQVELTNFIRSDDGTIADIKNALNEVDEIASRRFYRRTKLWLIPTAEVSLTNYVREEILDEGELPLRFTALTPCFRAEAGAAGRDTRGMIRMHQFTKVELVSITAPEQSNAEHERMTDCAQEILKRLDLHHRVVTLCAGDMGFTAKKTYDIEVWLPGQGAFREISSCSNCGDFQARRMNTRARAKDAKATRFVHTLNGSALAVGRALVAVLENYQQTDGSIAIPDVLKPYMGGVEKIEAVT